MESDKQSWKVKGLNEPFLPYNKNIKLAHPHLWIFQQKRQFSEKPFASGFGTVGSMG